MAIQGALQIPAIRHYDKYLGLPSFVGRNRRVCFTKIKERIWARMQGWKEKLLSQAGKEVMIKAVVQSIPVYSMNVFKLPGGLCKDIEAMIRKFWWSSGETKKIHWVKWSSLCSPKSIGGMGFRDLQKFNYAMLAKQVWRLIHHKDTLLYKVFSAKYFPQGSILDAPVHPKSSYAWRSILQAREVILKGAIWRIGNGDTIKVWDHHWLPEPGCSKIISPRMNSDVVKVSELFYSNSRAWDPGKLAACFIPWEAEKVGGIYVDEDANEDVLVWPLSSTGSYTVRSAYRMLMEADSSALPSSSSPLSEQSIWKKIWKLKVPKKVCHFLWRAARDSLPTKQNLRRRQIPLDVTCDGCNDQPESILHCLWLCDASAFQCAQFAMTAWCLWERRNRMRVHQRTWQIHEIGDIALKLVREFWEVHCSEPQSKVRPALVRWNPPPTTCYKINFDAATLDGYNQVGLGVVCRDFEGNVLAALSQKVGKVQSVEMAEALAAKRAVIFARELSLFDVQVEGDCLRVIQALQDADRCYTLYGHIIDETKKLGRVLRHCNFQHVKRDGNRLAHGLARRATLAADTDVWVEDLPRDLDVVFQSDVP